MVSKRGIPTNEFVGAPLQILIKNGFFGPYLNNFRNGFVEAAGEPPLQIGDL
jgi:hypothetical protein